MSECPGPPSNLMIDGLPDSASLLPGTTASLVCSANAGSPAASLEWFRGDAPMASEAQVDGDMVSAIATFTAQLGDTELRCVASNEVMMMMMMTLIILMMMIMIGSR